MHRWIVNRWIVYRELAQPFFTLISFRSLADGHSFGYVFFFLENCYVEKFSKNAFQQQHILGEVDGSLVSKVLISFSKSCAKRQQEFSYSGGSL